MKNIYKYDTLLEEFSKEDLILNYIKNNRKITRAIAQTILGLERSRTNDLLNSLCKQSLIKKEGSGRNTVYVIK